MFIAQDKKKGTKKMESKDAIDDTVNNGSSQDQVGKNQEQHGLINITHKKVDRLQDMEVRFGGARGIDYLHDNNGTIYYTQETSPRSNSCSSVEYKYNDRSVTENRVRNHQANNNNNSLSSSIPIMNSPYTLLMSYARDAKIRSRAHRKSANFFLNLYRVLNYPTVLLSAVSSVLAGVKVDQYFLLCTSLTILVLGSFDHTISPKNSQHLHLMASQEYEEIAGNIKQFIQINNRSHEEIKQYSISIHEYINKWNGFAPNIPFDYLQKSKVEKANRIRGHKSLYHINTSFPI